MGLFPIDMMINREGRRLSAMHAYLPSRVATERRDRLTLCTGAVATKLELSPDGSTVTGVYLVDGQNETRTARQCLVKARREVVVCCGAMFSPQILMLR